MSILNHRRQEPKTFDELMGCRYRSEKDLDCLAQRLGRYADSIDSYEYRDSGYSILEARKDVNDPDRLRGVIEHIENDDVSTLDMDNASMKSAFGFTRLQRKHLLSDLKRRFNNLIRKR